MGRISREECQRRREEILDVAEALYQEKPFQEINIKEIGDRISFTRTAIYSYFDNREEIYLSLLERIYRDWIHQLEKLGTEAARSRQSFAEQIAKSLADRPLLLKILSVDMASLDALSPMESLVSFKRVYGRSLNLMKELLEHHFPDRSEEANEDFIFTFFPLLYGIYPYTQVTPKQREAMEEAAVPYRYQTAEQMLLRSILQIL